MALSRRGSGRVPASIWPGFVDAMTGLLLVLMFVLTIFMVVQFVLRETISGQETELNSLSSEISALAQALGLQQRRNQALETRLGALTATLDDSAQRLAEQQSIISSLTATRDRQAAALDAADARIASFEDQVAGLLIDRDTARAQVADLETAQSELLSEQDALSLALASARQEVDAQAEAARLAAARREAMEALVADLRVRNADVTDQVGTLSARVDDLAAALSDEEAQRLAEAEAAAALRARLETADTELTVMTMALEEQRARAEETLTLLAASRSAEEDLNARLAAALLEGREQAQELRTRLDAVAAQLDAAEVAQSDSAGVIAGLEQDLSTERRARADAEQALSEAQGVRTELSSLQAQLTAALVRIQETEALRAQNESLTTQLEDGQSSAASQRALIDDLRARLVRAESIAAEQGDDQQSLEERLAAALAARMAAEASVAETRERLTAALAAQEAAQSRAADALTQAETRAALLQAAQTELGEENARASEAQKQTELLNQQVAALRQQLSALRGLLNEARASDAESQVQVQNLGSELNTALARVAAEERRRRQLEEAERKRLEAQTQDLERYRSEFFGRLRDVLGAQDGVRIEGDRFVFSSEVLFQPGSASLSRAGQGEVAKVAGILRSVADDIPAGIDWVIRVDGHTDNVPLSGFGEFADNWELSQARALSVVRYMIDFLGIPPNRLAANGFGQYQPVNPADTDEARAQNRRIELKFTEK
ncbi:peptidoglycan -binding protein [Puniceibacterium sp. IMCC21224]|uniref:peptidoglycan -binding protein n=1 Tax=Puniceibacterium sp. IMCC21224 TaxID=1618204 RepID=UPI00064DC379|nr:peptidoglycan -binding protein [Puniceibacterium sp. IMCC21224]KMK68872.1 flagellar motor protein [Puniceibacterium sp. IMCC21224]